MCKVEVVKRWACAMVSFYLILWACLTGRFPVLGLYAEGSTLALYSAARAD